MAALGKLKKISSHIGTKDSMGVAVTIKDIPVGDIQIKENVRTKYTCIDELKDSIRQYGLLQPITVYRDTNDELSYIVKTGHRRFMAYKKLAKEYPDRFHSIRCIISSDNDIAIVQLIENVQREILSDFDIFNALSALRAQKFTHKQIAEIMGKSLQYIDNLFTGINEIQNSEKLLEHITTAGGSIRDIVETKGIPDDKRDELLQQRKNGTISRQDLRKTVKKVKAPKSKSNKVKVEMEVIEQRCEIVLTLSHIKASGEDFDAFVESVMRFFNDSGKCECISKPAVLL
ncbi:chromosome partitioning protein ParB [Spirochaetia bacterium]|nr:chromosome partitioning protein ParB [Spirochaetia bacterium]